LAGPLLSISYRSVAYSAFGTEVVRLPRPHPHVALPALADVRLGLRIQKYLADQHVLLEKHPRR
jgi:hypothetical protein